MSAPLPHDESPRLQALEQYGILHSSPDPALDEIVRLAAQICGCPVAGIVLLDRQKPVYKSLTGFPAAEPPQGTLPCLLPLLADNALDILEIRDALEHPEYAPAGIVLGEQGDHSFRFCAGVSLTTPEGVRIGCLCVMDLLPRELAPEQASALTILSRQVITRFELGRRVRRGDEKTRAEDKLRALVRQSNSILEAVGDGIYSVDLEGKVTAINPAAAQMLGYEPQEMLGRRIHGLIHHSRADGSPYAIAECPVINSLKNLTSVRVADEIFWRRDGSCFPVDYVAQPQIDPGSNGGGAGKAVGVVVAFTDVTERQALDRMKDEFISTVSHELRTPLTSLRAALGLIGSGTLASRPDKREQMLNIAIANTERLVRLVNDILDLERIRSGKAGLHSTMCSANDLLRRAAELEQPRAAKARIQFRFDAGDVGVWADPDRILQALTNLISNAIKFSPPGSEIHLSAQTLAEDEAQIVVRDQGRGIPNDKLEQIFERFQQIDASDTRSMGGTGLGLAICRSIVTQHGGRIWACSTPGAGTTFCFTLPTRPSNHLR